MRGFGRRRPDVTLSLLRFTNFIGPSIETPLTRYFSLPVVPTVLRLRPAHPALPRGRRHRGAAPRCARRTTPASSTSAAAGVLLLSQAIRRLGRPSLPVPSPAVSLVARAFRSAGLVDFSPEQMRYLEHGRVADVSRLRGASSAGRRAPTSEAFDDFVAPRRAAPRAHPRARGRGRGEGCSSCSVAAGATAATGSGG